MKGPFRIGGSIVIGVLIVLGAFYVNARVTPEPKAGTGAVVVSAAPVRTAIEVSDEDGDGIPDWEETLKDTISFDISSENATYTPPTTLTGKFSEAFLQDYLEGKMRGQDFSDPDAFIGQAVEAVEASTQSKKHTRAELELIDTTEESLRAYGNELVVVMNRHYVPSRNELEIIGEAIEKKDADILEELAPIEENYQKIITDTREMRVPDELALTHVDLLNAYESVLFDIVAMGQVFDDPLLAIARMRKYEDDIGHLTESLRMIGSILDSQSIVYEDKEPGAFFYIFDAI